MSRVMLKSLLYIIALLICGGSLYYFYCAVAERHLLSYYDLPLFIHAAEHAWQGKDIYVRGVDLPYLYSPGAPVFKFPLPYLFLFMPWTFNGMPNNFTVAFCIVMSVVFLLSGLLSCHSLLSPYRDRCQTLHLDISEFRASVFIVLCFFITAIFFPFLEALGGVCGENFILLFLLIGFVLMKRHPFIAGMIISYTAWMKIYPAFILVYIIAKRQWTVLYGWLFGFAAIFLLTLFIFDMKEILYYFNTVLPTLLVEKIDLHWHNANLIFLLYGHGVIDQLNGSAFTVLRAIVILPVLYVLLSRRAPVFWRDAAEYAWIIITMIICLPNLWTTYYVVLLFPVLVMTGILALHGMWIRLFFFGWVVFCLVANDIWVWKIAAYCCNVYRDMPYPANITDDIQHYGLGMTMFRHSVLGWLVFVGSQIKALMPMMLWLVYAAWLLPRRASHI